MQNLQIRFNVIKEGQNRRASRLLSSEWIVDDFSFDGGKTWEQMKETMRAPTPQERRLALVLWIIAQTDGEQGGSSIGVQVGTDVLKGARLLTLDTSFRVILSLPNGGTAVLPHQADDNEVQSMVHAIFDRKEEVKIAA